MTTTNTPGPIRFGMRTLMLVLTGTCVLLAILQWLFPKDLPIAIRIAFTFVLAGSFAFAVWSFYQSKRHPWKTPEDFVMVKVDAKWKRRVKNPLILGPIATLTGVSISFAPLFLLWLGQVEKFGVLEWIAVSLCFLIIYLVPAFYISLAGEVMAELYRSESTVAQNPGVDDEEAPLLL